jgi:hypothetical protein
MSDARRATGIIDLSRFLSASYLAKRDRHALVLVANFAKLAILIRDESQRFDL